MHSYTYLLSEGKFIKNILKHTRDKKIADTDRKTNTHPVLLYFTVISFCRYIIKYPGPHCFCDCLRTEKLLRLDGAEKPGNLKSLPRDEFIAESGRRVGKIIVNSHGKFKFYL
ncbi:hypothetical protein BACCOPRO_03676 [Phocaeicola coprophilus DSM 18228 = JCM 13818]|uniref:Uncharacterized protein n=1 Tax=Phocaeicola coprophilus DSM 18228 = JCM 13818 TaxID=547042 RepID=S0FES3_9BACT|nr:hypothetical protein BACCOPRO_03676 [Phocaeicola coprophilus DSM 18228 = JCM 13818]